MENRKEIGIVKFMLLGAGIILFVQIVFGLVLHWAYPDWQDTGVIGDTFGALNPLFSGLAFVGVIFAIILQKKELELQRKELELTREELKRSASAQNLSQEALNRQAHIMELSSKVTLLNATMKAYDGRLFFEDLNPQDQYIKIEELKQYFEKLIREIEKEFINTEK